MEEDATEVALAVAGLAERDARAAVRKERRRTEGDLEVEKLFPE